MRIVRLLLGGCIGGVIVGLLYCLMLVWFVADPLRCAVLGVLLAWAGTWLGRQHSGLNGGILWLGALTALAATIELLWMSDVVDFADLSLDEQVCLAWSFVAFVLGTGFLARTPDKLFH